MAIALPVNPLQVLVLGTYDEWSKASLPVAAVALEMAPPLNPRHHLVFSLALAIETHEGYCSDEDEPKVTTAATMLVRYNVPHALRYSHAGRVDFRGALRADLWDPETRTVKRTAETEALFLPFDGNVDCAVEDPCLSYMCGCDTRYTVTRIEYFTV